MQKENIQRWLKRPINSCNLNHQHYLSLLTLQPLSTLSSTVEMTTVIRCLLGSPRHTYPPISRLLTRQPGSLLVSLATLTFLPTGTDVLHCLPVASRIQYKVLLLDARSSSKISLQPSAQSATDLCL